MDKVKLEKRRTNIGNELKTLRKSLSKLLLKDVRFRNSKQNLEIVLTQNKIKELIELRKNINNKLRSLKRNEKTN